MDVVVGGQALGRESAPLLCDPLTWDPVDVADSCGIIYGPDSMNACCAQYFSYMYLCVNDPGPRSHTHSVTRLQRQEAKEQSALAYVGKNRTEDIIQCAFSRPE